MTHLLCSSLITIPSGQPHPLTHTLGQGEATPIFEQVVGHSGAQSINICPSYGHSVHVNYKYYVAGLKDNLPVGLNLFKILLQETPYNEILALQVAPATISLVKYSESEIVPDKQVTSAGP